MQAARVHSPDERDDAEQARSTPFNWLAETPGKATFDALLRFAQNPDFPISPSRLRTIAHYSRCPRFGDSHLGRRTSHLSSSRALKQHLRQEGIYNSSRSDVLLTFSTTCCTATLRRVRWSVHCRMRLPFKTGSPIVSASSRGVPIQSSGSHTLSARKNQMSGFVPRSPMPVWQWKSKSLSSTFAHFVVPSNQESL